MKFIYYILTFIAGFIVALIFDNPCKCKECPPVRRQEVLNKRLQEPIKEDCGCSQR